MTVVDILFSGALPASSNSLDCLHQPLRQCEPALHTLPSPSWRHSILSNSNPAVLCYSVEIFYQDIGKASLTSVDLKPLQTL